MATQVPGTQDEAMLDAPGNRDVDGQDEDAIIGREDLVVQVVGVSPSSRGAYIGSQLNPYATASRRK